MYLVRVYLVRLYLVRVYLVRVYLVRVYLVRVYLVRVYLVRVYLVRVYLVRVYTYRPLFTSIFMNLKKARTCTVHSFFQFAVISLSCNDYLQTACMHEYKV